ncbi:PREDICTED: growth hormone-regulated TBC protein 1-A-like [Priapulus caudatus]|uniref:Growth hormone-regulated TBC protein 1-A-like n=1 Tax=Priapulus caudatus TaxID=37621 RepID=A0ABM1EM22_PRICU|nr:PREDICTED: growth hormone-regulated TBC protein 1-A-like [Priapulus caudatus]XP_014673243.1 PREDICTED: growth hormone-regulated TBC protein 1-A-like [Priapulus caudatus]XP_014673244.1 PREDICTED: growth hormone-regulated TBC protein 1-A-like [Priapulus caudatus]
MATAVKVDGYGFERPEDFDFETYEEFMSRYLSVLVRRAKKWEQLFGSSPLEDHLKRSSKVKRYTRKGIPGDKRALVWMTMSGALARMQANPGVYQRLLEAPTHDDPVIDAIRTDIHRTFPENVFFVDAPEGQRVPLFNVLVAFARRRPDVGYCQGLNFVAGMLLLVVKDEERSFWLLDAFVGGVVPTGYYTPAMTGLRTDTRVLAELVRARWPDVDATMRREGATFDLVATKWFVCAYVDVLPVETLLRIWDSLFYEGAKVVFRVAVTMVARQRARVAAARGLADVVSAFRVAIDDPANTFAHDFMADVFRVPGSFPMATIDKLREQCERAVLEEDR